MKRPGAIFWLGGALFLVTSPPAFAGGNATPTFSQGATLTRVSGAPPINAKIGVVADAETPAQNLVVTVTSAHSGSVVSNIVVAANGDVTADVGVDCQDGGVINGGVNVQVSDGQATAPGQFIVNIFRRGDLNNDGKIDVFDLVAQAGFIAGNLVQGVSPFLAPLGMANMNTDEIVDVFDLVLLAGKIVGNVPCPP